MLLWTKGKDFCHFLVCNKNINLRKQATIPYLQPLFYIPQLFLPLIHIHCKYAQNRQICSHLELQMGTAFCSSCTLWHQNQLNSLTLLIHLENKTVDFVSAAKRAILMKSDWWLHTAIIHPLCHKMCFAKCYLCVPHYSVQYCYFMFTCYLIMWYFMKILISQDKCI